MEEKELVSDTIDTTIIHKPVPVLSCIFLFIKFIDPAPNAL